MRKKNIFLKGVSLFSSAGIAEYYLHELGIDIVVANELLPQRANLYQKQYPKTKMICGNILDSSVFQKIIDNSPEELDFLIASPPCQGMSVAGKNRTLKQMMNDDRNLLIFKVIEFIELKKPSYILIENVPAFLKMKYTLNNNPISIIDFLTQSFSDYIVEGNIYNSAEYGVAQIRKRSIIKMYKKGCIWGNPCKEKQIPISAVIGDLPSLEAGESSELQWHFARKHTEEHIQCMKHTKSGKSALDNAYFYPKNKNGEKTKAYKTTYKRMSWDEPAPTITIRNDAISSQQNVHPGRKKQDGTYSDARVLTPLELMLLSSLPANWNIPKDTPELLIRKCLGECIPPLLIKKIVSKIGVLDVC